MSIVRHDDLGSKRELSTAELAEVAWSEGLKFCRLKYVGGHECAEPCNDCYQTALNFLIAEAQRLRKRDG